MNGAAVGFSALLPCPFCGGNDVGVFYGTSFSWRVAQCNYCGAQAGEVRIQTAGSGTEQDWYARATAGAVAEWNKRPIGPQEE